MATYVIEKGENYHFVKTENCYEITYSNENKLFSQEITNLPNTPKSIGFFDEKITLYDGKKLTRIKDLISFSEE